MADETFKSQSHKSFRTKQKLARAQKQNRPIPQWIRLRTGNTIRYALVCHFAAEFPTPHELLSLEAGSAAQILEESSGMLTEGFWMKTDTMRRGGIGARPVLESRRLFPPLSSRTPNDHPYTTVFRPVFVPAFLCPHSCLSPPDRPARRPISRMGRVELKPQSQLC